MPRLLGEGLAPHLLGAASRPLVMAMVVGAMALTAQAATISYDSDATIAEALTLEEDTEISVASGATVTYSAAISGNFKLTKTGVGTLVLGVANSFGSLDINAGILTVAKAGALGSGAVTIAGSTSAACQLRFDTTLIQTAATFSNAITLSSSSANGYPAIYFVLPTSGTAVYTVTLSGNITANGNLYLADNRGGSTDAKGSAKSWQGKQWVVFSGEVNAAGHRLQFGCGNSYRCGPCGDIYWNGKVTAATYYYYGYTGDNYGSAGDIYFSSSENQIGLMQGSYNNIYLTKENALGNAKINILEKTYSADRSRYVLSADQCAKSLVCPTVPVTDKDNCKIINAKSASTLTLNGGTSDSASCCAKLIGALSLVIDGAEDGFVQTCYGRINTMTGSITVKKGSFKVTEATIFSYVPTLDVQGGTLEINSTTDTSFPLVDTVKVANGGLLKLTSTTLMPFSDRIVNLELGETGKVYIPEGVTWLLNSLTINGTQKSAGQYTAAELANNIEGGGTIDTFGAASENTWTGGAGDDKKINTAGNWQSAVSSFTDGTLDATFASDGEEAVVNTLVWFSALTFDTPAGKSGFAFTPQDEGELKLSSNIEFADDQDANKNAHVYTLGAPMTLLAEQVWNVPTNDTLKVTGGLTSDYGISLDGKGKLEFSGTNTIDGRLEFTNFERLTLTGKLTASDPESQGEPSTAINGHSLYINHKGQYYNTVVPYELIPVVFDNVYIDKPTYIMAANNYRRLIYCTPSTTNIFARKLTTGRAQFAITVGTNAVMSLNGGVYSDWSFYKEGSGLMRIADNPWSQEDSLLGIYGGPAKIEVAGNRFNRLVVNDATAYLEIAVDNAITSAACCELTKGTMNISVGTQRVPFVLATAKATLTGSEGTVLFFTNGGVPVGATKYGTTNLCCKITGAVGVTQGGANKLIVNTVSESTGPLTVTNGVLELAANASWLHGTDFTARGKGTLKFAAASQINSDIAALHLAGSGKVEIPSGVTLKVASAETNGVALAIGSYTSAELGSFITGAGTLKVGKKGTTIMLW